MINVNYLGGIGNNLFQYTAGRLLAKRTGLRFNGFFGSNQFTELARFYGLSEDIDGLTLRHPKVELPSEGQSLDMASFDGFKGNLVVRGYLQSAKIYQDYLEEIRGWFYDKSTYYKTYDTNSTLICHVRLGDYKPRGWVVPFSYYEEVVDRVKPSHIYVYTDEPNHSYIQNFTKLPGYLAPSDFDAINSFFHMSSAPHLCIPCSTFSWWAGLIGNGQVYMPKPIKGFWSEKDGVNLRINHPRFHIVDCDRPISLSDEGTGGYIHKPS